MGITVGEIGIGTSPPDLADPRDEGRRRLWGQEYAFGQPWLDSSIAPGADLHGHIALLQVATRISALGDKPLAGMAARRLIARLNPYDHYPIGWLAAEANLCSRAALAQSVSRLRTELQRNAHLGD